MDEVESPKDDPPARLRQGCRLVRTGEGIARRRLNRFARTVAAPKKAGWKLTGDTELFAEPNDKDLCDNCDNLTVALGAMWCQGEDGGGEYPLGITPAGRFTSLAATPRATVNLPAPPSHPMAHALREHPASASLGHHRP